MDEKVRTLRQMLRLRRIQEYEQRSLAADAFAQLRQSRSLHAQAERSAENVERLRHGLLNSGNAIDASRYQQVSAYESHVNSARDDAARQLAECDDRRQHQTVAWAKAKKTTRLTARALQAATDMESRGKRTRDRLEYDDIWLAARGRRHEH